MPDITVRYAESDQDVIHIHQFLCIVAGPHLPSDINPQKSATEVWRVVDAAKQNYGFALMAMQGEALVGTIGIIHTEFWWGDASFFANRWFFWLPGSGASKPLLREAKAVAVAAGLELHIISENRGKVLILNKSVQRTRLDNVLRINAADPADAAAAASADAAAATGDASRDFKRHGDVYPRTVAH